MRFRLRTLLILLVVIPPLIAEIWLSVTTYQARRRRELDQAKSKAPAVIR
jgi:hypothetical protein